MSELLIQTQVPLAALTTLELGGAAEHFVRVQERAHLLEALRWAKLRGMPVTLLGGGSNVLVSDAGVAGLVIQMASCGVQHVHESTHVRVTARAGEPWDAFVASCVQRNLAGIECLSGIPGLVGATPIQNVGAYGQEVADTISSVEVLNRKTLKARWLRPKDCGFGYRASMFKEQPERYVVLSVEYELLENGAPGLRYEELGKALEATATPSLAAVRDAVLALRAKKSMVLDPLDENRRSAGSFFTNPIVSPAQADSVVARALAHSMVTDAAQVPRYAQSDGRVKLAAGWLIERAGTRRGERHGHFGVSSRHALSLVHHGGGTTRELLELAARIVERVQGAFDVTLTREPVLLGA